jgi:hypothetical protein
MDDMDASPPHPTPPDQEMELLPSCVTTQAIARTTISSHPSNLSSFPFPFPTQ